MPPDLRPQHSPLNSPRAQMRKPEVAELNTKAILSTPRSSNRLRSSMGVSTPKSPLSASGGASRTSGSHNASGFFFGQQNAGGGGSSQSGSKTNRSSQQTSRSQGGHPGSRDSNPSGGQQSARRAAYGGGTSPSLPLRNQLSLGALGSGSQSPQGCMTAPHNSMSGMRYFPAPAGILPELAAPQSSRSAGHPLVSGAPRSHRDHCLSTRTPGRNHHGMGGKGGGAQSPTPASLSLITSVAGDPLLFSETNMDWSKLNIFRTRLCDRLTQTRSCHMANRCLFSHDVNWPRRTPFLPRATALTLRYIPVWCPRLSWPPLVGYCDSSGKMSWTSSDDTWNARLCHQNCTRGENCPFVHNVEEFLYHPEIYKTRSCCLANDDNFDEQMNGSCVALCPWYFCPFAHDVYELRNLRESRYAWHPPPQIVADDHVARTQDFNDLEKRIIDFVRRSPNGSLGLYSSPDSPLSPQWRERMPPVVRPIAGSSLEKLVPSADHLHGRLDNALLHLMVLASFANLLLYPVENFYVPTLLSLQCAVLHSQLHLPADQPIYNCATLLEKFEAATEQRQREEAQHPTSSTPGRLESIPAGEVMRPSPRLVPEWEITGSSSQFGSLMGSGPAVLDFLSPPPFGLAGPAPPVEPLSGSGELPSHRLSTVSSDHRRESIPLGLPPEANTPPSSRVGFAEALDSFLAETPLGSSHPSAASGSAPDFSNIPANSPSAASGTSGGGASLPFAAGASPSTEELQALLELLKPQELLQVIQLINSHGTPPTATTNSMSSPALSTSANTSSPVSPSTRGDQDSLQAAGDPEWTAAHQLLAETAAAALAATHSDASPDPLAQSVPRTAASPSAAQDA